MGTRKPNREPRIEMIENPISKEEKEPLIKRQPRNIINSKNRNSWIESSPKDLDEVSVSKPWRHIRYFGLMLTVIGGLFSAFVSVYTGGRASFWGELLKAIALATNGLIILFDNETFKNCELKFQYGITKLGGLLIAMTVAIGIIMGDPEGFYKIEPKSELN